MLHVICGAPCAGKSTYVQKHARRGDLIVDADKIAETIGAGTDHQASGLCWNAALAARETLISYAKKSSGDSWIIHTAPSKAQMREYRRHNADIVVLDPGIDVCKQRAALRPRGTVEAIENWYNYHASDLVDPKDIFVAWAKETNFFQTEDKP